jgi:hypothetical protein
MRAREQCERKGVVAIFFIRHGGGT